MRSSLSTFTLVALCVGATVLPACAAPFPTSSDVDLQRRTVSGSGLVNNVWLNTVSLPDSTGYPPDYFTYADLGVNENEVVAAVQDAFITLINNGVSAVSAPGQPNNTPVTNGGFDSAISVQIFPVSELDTKEQPLTDWFNTAQQDPTDTSLNLAAWIVNTLESSNMIEACAEPYFNDFSPWGAILVQVGSPGPYNNAYAPLDAKISACLNANY